MAKRPTSRLSSHDQDVVQGRVVDRCLVPGAGLAPGVLRFNLGQVQGKHRALAKTAGHVDVAAGLLGEAEHLRQPQARAFAHGLGGEEGLENAFECLSRNTAAGVGQDHHDKRLASFGIATDARQRVHRGDAQGQGALAVHGVAGVECDIDQRSFELA